MVVHTHDSRGRGIVLEQTTNLELQPGPQIPPDSARRNILVQRPSAVGTKVDKDLVIQRQIIRSGSGSISRQWHVGGEAIAESLGVIPSIAMVTLILLSWSLVSRTLSINGTANLQVRGTAAQPVILGRINLDSGDLIFNGDRFILNGGTIQFVNPSETQPVVNLALNTTIQEYSINLRFSGPVDQLHTEYASDPSLPAADIINLLAFGKTTEANSASRATPANQRAASLVASQVSSQVTSRISKVAGISQLSIDPVLAGGSTQGPPGANITIQQRVTGNFFFTFSSNLASTQEQTIMGQYQVTPRVAVSATRDQSGGFGFDATIKKTW